MKSASRIEIWSDVTDYFSYIDELLVYNDEPIEGFLKSKTGELYAFRTLTVVRDLLWHWTLLPVENLDQTIQEVFSAAAAKSPNTWISIVEDSRGSERRLHAAWLTAPFVPPGLSKSRVSLGAG